MVLITLLWAPWQGLGGPVQWQCHWAGGGPTHGPSASPEPGPQRESRARDGERTLRTHPTGWAGWGFPSRHVFFSGVDSGYGSILHLAQLSFSLQLYVESPKVFIQHERPSAACCS